MEAMIYRAVLLATEKYDVPTLQHAMRVANYARDSKMAKAFLDTETLDRLYCIGLLHDIIEDTDITDKELCVYFPPQVVACISELTKEKDEVYQDYIKSFNDASILSYLVKMADMKDHLKLRETLTDKLKEKYLTALPELL